MKRSVAILSGIVAVYFVSYFVVRWQLHDSPDVNVATPSGNQVVHEERTFIWIPGTGFERIARQTLYWSFYPAGQIDRVLTGRIYDRTDARNIQLRRD